jgi:hypothetical protein
VGLKTSALCGKLITRIQTLKVRVTRRVEVVGDVCVPVCGEKLLLRKQIYKRPVAVS